MEENMGNTKKKQDVMQDEAGAVIEGDGASTEKPCCCKKHKKRDDKEYNDLMNRLSRIEGQVRGIKRMLEDDAYCPDILIQVSAINAALTSFNKVLLANHIRTCVTRDIREGKDETVEELIEVCQKVMK
jgi:DNA-binding FrmR family transcriptional regulator